MAKRYLETTFFKSPFVRGLKAPLKGLYMYIICDCDGAGIWIADFDVASIYMGQKITEHEFIENFVNTGKCIDLKDGKYFFPDFIEHQYPSGLSETNPAHKNFIIELKKYSLIDEKLKVLERPLQDPLEGSNVYVKVMEKVRVKVKDENFDFKNSLINYGFDSKKVDEWIEVRRKSKAVNTETAFNGFIREVEKSGKDKNEILTRCIEKNWRGFESEWIEKKETKPDYKHPTPIQQMIIDRQNSQK